MEKLGSDIGVLCSIPAKDYRLFLCLYYLNIRILGWVFLKSF